MKFKLNKYIIYFLSFLIQNSHNHVAQFNKLGGGVSLIRPWFLYGGGLVAKPTYVLRQLTSDILGSVPHALTLNRYLAQWYTLTRYKFFLKKVYFNKLLGSYPVSKFYFFYNNIFYPSDGNIVIFNKSMRRLKFPTPPIDKITASKLITYLEFGNTMQYINNRINLSFSLKKHNFFLNSRDRVIKWSQSLGGLTRFKFRGFKFEIRKKIWLTRKLIRFFKRLLRKFLRRTKPQIRKYSGQGLVHLKLITLVYKPLLGKKIFKNLSTLRKKVNFFKEKLINTVGISFIKNNTALGNYNVLLFKKYLSLIITFKFPILIKQLFFHCNKKVIFNQRCLLNLQSADYLSNTNLLPSTHFNYTLKKIIVLFRSNLFLKENIVPWIYNSLIRFVEYCSGKKSLLQLYPFMNQSISLEFIILYKRWLPRFLYFEKKLGHRFFMEEAFHIIHMGFNLHDVKLITSWLSAIIKRISFWKTRLIFRFIKYVFNNYYLYIFSQIGIKGFKVKLKGKISAAGNSRKRSILYRVGKTSHATTNLKVLYNLSTIVTFTGVQGLQVWIFY